MTARMTQTLGRARGILKGFTPGQRGVIVVVALALVLGAVALTRWAAQPTWTPLFSNLSGPDANAIVEQLRSESVPYQLAAGGNTVLVPQSQVYDLRVQLAGKGLPSSDSNGYSILDKQGLTATDFQQNVAYRRALESELSRTLQAMSGVQTAIVHVAIPQKDVFATEQDKPTASVLLALTPGTTLDRSQVRAVTHLVAGSVEGLDPNDVTVTNQKGALLSTRETGAAGAAAAAGEADQQTAQYEDRLSGTVQQMLDRVLGPGHAVVRVNAQLNFDTRATTSERYVSETGVPPLSEATTRETYNGGAAGNGGALGQTWPTLAPAAGSSGAGSYDRQQRTVDNAVGKVVESAQAAPGTVQRLTVAVVLDSGQTAGTDATTVQQLVSNAVGLNGQRGDTVEVSSLPFDTTAATEAAKEIKAAQSAERTSQLLDIGTKVGLGLAAVIVLFLLLRKRGRGEPIEAYASDLPDETLLPAMRQLALPQAQAPGLPAQLGSALPLPLPAGGGDPAEHALPAGQAEKVAQRDRLRDEVAQLVENQPDEVAQVIQGWLAQRKS